MTIAELYKMLPVDMDGITDYPVSVHYCGFSVPVYMDVCADMENEKVNIELEIRIVYSQEEAITAGALFAICEHEDLSEGRLVFTFGPYVRAKKVKFNVTEGLVLDLEEEKLC